MKFHTISCPDPPDPILRRRPNNWRPARDRAKKKAMRPEKMRLFRTTVVGQVPSQHVALSARVPIIFQCQLARNLLDGFFPLSHRSGLWHFIFGPQRRHQFKVPIPSKPTLLAHILNGLYIIFFLLGLNYKNHAYNRLKWIVWPIFWPWYIMPSFPVWIIGHPIEYKATNMVSSGLIIYFQI